MNREHADPTLRALLRAYGRAVHRRATALTRKMYGSRCKRQHDAAVKEARRALETYLRKTADGRPALTLERGGAARRKHG